MKRRPAAVAAGAACSIVVLALGPAACGGDDDDEGSSPQPSATVDPPRTSTTTSTTTSAPPPPALEDVRVTLTEVATLDEPIAMAVRDGFDALFVAERGGRVVLLQDGQVRPEPVIDISGETQATGERGLLGMTISPDGERLYLSYTDLAGDSHLDEVTFGDGVADVDLGSRRELLRIDQPYPNHNGGNIVFGPDSLLWYGLGDGGSQGDPQGRAQNPNELLGKILRIEPRAVGGDPYAIPADNPFAGGGGRGEVAILGVRNPWRFSFDRATGDLWIGDVGGAGPGEVDVLPSGTAVGANLGWDRVEGTVANEGEAPPGAVAPVFEYSRSEGYSITGGYVYRGEAIPGLQGAYVFGDYGSGIVNALGVEDGRVTARHDLGVTVDPAGLASFGEDQDGELFLLSLSGEVYRLDPA